ncbi:MAG: hypothetical protein OQL06_01595 [Gammaproteobacteria bacterium]|nr:hypothetical protein [Gammaproteobacteria bacterium]
MIRYLLFVLAFVYCLPVNAGKTYFDFRYDNRTGEFSLVIPSSGKSYDGYGYNMKTGQMWFNQINPQGARGVDPHGNYWIYDRRSGVYINSNGRRCMGFGRYRRCNW